MLKAESLAVAYEENLIVKDINLEIAKGDMVTIIGANGSGKSTILKAMSRSLKPCSGIVYLDGREIFRQDSKAVARKLAVLPQTPRVPDDFTVRDLVSYGRYPHLGWNARMKIEDFEVVDWAAKVTRIGHFQHRMVSTLSGGERQRAWIAMAIAQQPQVLLLDEPTTFLDIGCQFEVLELVKNLNEELGITVVMVLHDLNQAARYSKSILVLKDGEIYKKGSPHEVITEKILEDVFKIRVKVFEDADNNCPYFIPMGSCHSS